MINLLHWFKKQPPTKTENNEQNYLKLLINAQDIAPIMLLDINDTSNKAAHQFAKAMIALNSGTYCQDIIDLLNELSHRSDDYAKFVQMIFLSWKAQLGTISAFQDDNNEDPIVPPTHFSQSTK
jgi:hypothetical protein